MSHKQFKTNKKRIAKLQEKVENAAMGVPWDQIEKHGGGKELIVNDKPANVAEQEEAIAALQHNLKIRKRAKDWHNNWLQQCDRYRKEEDERNATREIREQYQEENMTNKLSALQNKHKTRHRGNHPSRGNIASGG